MIFLTTAAEAKQQEPSGYPPKLHTARSEPPSIAVVAGVCDGDKSEQVDDDDEVVVVVVVEEVF